MSPSPPGMSLSLSVDDLAEFVGAQLSAATPDNRNPTRGRIRASLGPALDRVETCFSQVLLKRYRTESGAPAFSHLHAGQCAALYYFLSNEAWRTHGDEDLATRTYRVNRCLYGIDVWYEVALPVVFAWEHPLATVLGRASYGNRFLVYQRCTVGGNLDLEYPVLGSDVSMYAGSTVIGSSRIGDRVRVAAGTTIVDQDVPSDSVVFGTSPSLEIRPLSSIRRPVFDGTVTPNSRR